MGYRIHAVFWAGTILVLSYRVFLCQNSPAMSTEAWAFGIHLSEITSPSGNVWLCYKKTRSLITD